MREASDLSIDEIKQLEDEIDAMSHIDMAKRWRFSPVGDLMFRIDLPFCEKFKKKFKKFGGFTPKISKMIGRY